MGVLMRKKRELQIQCMEEAQGERPREDRGRAMWPQVEDGPALQVARRSSETAKTECPPKLSEGVRPCWHLHVQRLASRMVTGYLSVV